MINVAVIGVGSMGKNHARVFSTLSTTNLVAISEIVNELQKDVSSNVGCKGYSDYNEMLANESIDAVSVAVPTKLHKTIVMDCLRSGVHVLVEKPISESVQSSKIMIKEAKQKGVVFTVGHIERFNPGIEKLKEIISKGELGEITSITARRVGMYPPRIKDANVILDLAVHDIDIFNYLLDTRPDEVFAKSGAALKNDREDHALITLSYGDVSCFVQVNWITPVKVRELSVTGSKGYAELNYITQDLKVFQSNYEREYNDFGDFVFKFGEPTKIEIDVKKKEPLEVEIEHFIECIKGQKEVKITGEEALDSLIVCQGAIESYKKNRIVKIDYDR